MDMLPKDLPLKERFALAVECGFQAIEILTISDPHEAEAIAKASGDAHLPIHSVMNKDHWSYPLSSSDPAVVERSMQGMRTSIANAQLWHARTVLLVPAVVNPETSYQQAWDRSRTSIEKLVPLAEELRVIIGIEEVWNKFLLSPLEFARYVDEFKSPWIRAYFDVGNVKLYGYPQDWIRTLGPRIVKLHIKDFSWRKAPNGEGYIADFVPLLEGDIDWKAIYDALREINYRGSATVELPAGDAAYLKEVNRRFTEILDGTAKPIKRS
jgi:hexulose-6-phosphate isomerase